MRTIVVIPARYNSTRFPGKPMALINGQPMFLWTYQAALTCHKVERVILATDDERIYHAAKSFGCDVVMTGNHPSGTDRVYEVARGLSLDSEDLLVNLQGDEPLMPSGNIEMLFEHMREYPRSRMATLATPIGYDAALSCNSVKVVRDHSNRALYFSRCPIPYNSTRYLKQLGIYAYRLSTLALLCALPQAEIEQAESLEQLRALDHGIGIDVLTTDQNTIAVDTPSDLERVVEHLRQRV